MMSSLKTVAEAVISLLTMLLQFLIHQLEVCPSEDGEGANEMMQTMEGMVVELQNQRAILQSLLVSSQAGRQQASQSFTGNLVGTVHSTGTPKTRMSPSRTPSMPDPSMVPIAAMPDPNMMARPPHQVLQALHGPKMPMPGDGASSVTSRVTNWQVLEESEEEVIVDLEGRRIDLGQASAAARKAASQLALPMSLSDWGQTRITWGRKHKGSTYLQVLRADAGYFQWSVARCTSLPPDQQDFVKFSQMQMDLDKRA